MPCLPNITNETTAKTAIEKLSTIPVLGVDIETTGLDPHISKIRLASVAANDSVIVFGLRHIPIETLLPLCNRLWMTFSGNFECRPLTRAGLQVPLCHDVQLLDRLASHQMHRSLADAAKDWLGVQLEKQSRQATGWPMSYPRRRFAMPPRMR